MKRFVIFIVTGSIILSLALTVYSASRKQSSRDAVKPVAESKAAGDAWVNLGPYGGQITTLGIDPSKPRMMLAGSRGGDGLFMTTDGGETWSPVLTGNEGGPLEGQATFRNTSVWSLRYAPSNPAIVWAVHDISAEKSYLNGLLWDHIDNNRMQADCENCGGSADAQRICRSLAIDPSDPTRVYVGTGGPAGTPRRGAIYRTDDAGKNWKKIGFDSSKNFDGTVLDIAIHPEKTSVLYAMTGYDDAGDVVGNLYRGEEYGQRWKVIFQNRKFRFYDLEFWVHDSEIYFVATDKGIWTNLSGDPGFIQGLPEGRVLALALDSSNAGGPLLFASIDGVGIVRITLSGKAVQIQNSGVAEPIENLQLISLAVHPDDSRTLFGGDLKEGIYRAIYQDKSGGFAYQPLNRGVNARQIHDIDAIAAGEAEPDHLIAATNSGPEVYSRESGWQKAGPEAVSDEPAYAVTFDTAKPEARRFFVGGQGYLAATDDGGQKWSVLNLDDIRPDLQVSDIAPARDGSMLFVATRHSSGGSGVIYQSTDGGLNLKPDYEAAFDFNSIAVDPSDPERVFAGGGSFNANEAAGGIFVRRGAGQEWMPTGLENQIVNAILIDPDNPDILYAGCGNRDGSGTPLYKSVDGGRTWIIAAKGIPANPTLFGIWGSSGDDIWVPGNTGSQIRGGFDDRRMLYFDGAVWSYDMDAGTFDHLRSIAGRQQDDVYAVGAKGVIVHFNGKRWSSMEPEKNRTTDQDLNAVWVGKGPGDIYAVGNSGTILVYDGSRWSAAKNQIDAHLYGIWGDSEGRHLFAVGATGTILALFDDKWVPMVSRTNAQLTGTWGTADGRAAYVVGAPMLGADQKPHYTILQFDGRRWRLMDTPAVQPGRGTLRSVWGTSSSNVYAVGDDGVILRYDGKAWVAMDSGTGADLYGIWGTSSPKSIYAVGRYGTVLSYDGKQWRNVNPAAAGISGAYTAEANSVVDLRFHTDKYGKRILYGGTLRQGVYSSADEGRTWQNLSAPPYPLSSIAAGSAYAGGIGTHALAFYRISVLVVDDQTVTPLQGVQVRTDLTGWFSTDINGAHVFIFGAQGSHNVTAQHTGYAPGYEPNVPSSVSGTPVDFLLSQPYVEVRLNNNPVLASGGVFDAPEGSVTPAGVVGTDFSWSGGVGSGYLRVPYGYGSVNMVVSPKPNFMISSVRLNAVDLGTNSTHSLASLSGSNTFWVDFAAVPPACPADINLDLDVDGLDLSALAAGSSGVSASQFAAVFGLTQCP